MNEPTQSERVREATLPASNGMRLLIVTQAVDTKDPVLGFFHRWIEEMAAHTERAHVICLKEGTHSLPAHVTVHSLGKETGRSRLKYVLRFYSYIWRLRGEYDAVYVHMNQEYVLLGGLLWRLLGKKIVLWRNHKIGTVWTNIACVLSNTVCFTSGAAYVARERNAVQMPIGVDTTLFAPRGAVLARSVLFLGRLDPVKNVHLFVSALTKMYESGEVFKAAIYGSPTDPRSKYAHDVRNQATVLATEGVLSVHDGVTNDDAAKLFAEHEVYVNLTPSGSFDKTIGEAMSAGAIVVAMNAEVQPVLPASLFVHDETPESAAYAITAALALPSVERDRIVNISRRYISDEHSLTKLVTKLMPLLST